MKTKSLSTVNVILGRDDNIELLKSFSDDEKGNLAAENLFIDLIMKNDLKNRDEFMGTDYYLDEGRFSNGDVNIYLAHSPNYETKNKFRI